MRILVADQNALLLAAITATFGPHCDLVTATRRGVCLAVLEQHKFDVVIACDKLSDYTGLELLSEVPVISPDTLLIFAADPKRLTQLGKRLAVFGLFDTLSYPLTPQKLVDVLRRARERLLSRRAVATPAPPPPKPKVRHVVLESEWDTGERLGLVEQELHAELAQDGTQSAHHEWSRAAEVGASGDDGRVDDGADDFVFEGPPPSVQAMAEPSRAADAGRTFEGTPVVPTAARGDEVPPRSAGVTAYEVMPSADEFVFGPEPEARVVTTRSQAIGVAMRSEPRGGPPAQAAETLIEAEPGRPMSQPGGVPVAQEPTGIEELVCNDPVFDVPEPPRWAVDGAANDTAFEGKQGTHAARTLMTRGDAAESARGDASGRIAGPHTRAVAENRPPALEASSKPSKSSQPAKVAPSSNKGSPPQPGRPVSQPRVRAQTVPTPSQLAAFERAMARRLAAQRMGPEKPPAGAKARKTSKGAAGLKAEPTIQFPSPDLFADASASDQGSSRPSKSLSELARMAVTKRPLAIPNLTKTAVPKRAVFVVSSGLAAVLILGVLSFELLRNSNEAQHHMPHAQVQSLQALSSPGPRPTTPEEMAAIQLFAPQAGQTGSPSDVPPNQPQAQTFDPDTAPPDPPPPPPLEHPGPMEPPSMEHHIEPPPGMMPISVGSSE